MPMMIMCESCKVNIATHNCTYDGAKGGGAFANMNLCDLCMWSPQTIIILPEPHSQSESQPGGDE